MTREQFADAVEIEKVRHQGKLGPVEACRSQILLRELAAIWPHLPCKVNLRASDDAWECRTIDYGALAELLVLEEPTALRLCDRAARLGIIYPDGSVQDRVEEYLKLREKFALADRVTAELYPRRQEVPE